MAGFAGVLEANMRDGEESRRTLGSEEDFNR